MATFAASEPRIELVGTGHLLHEHLTASLGQTVFQQTRNTERDRPWSLEALASFWTEVMLRAPQSLTQALQEAARGNGSGWPPVGASQGEHGGSRPGDFHPMSSRPCWAYTRSRN